MYVATVIKKATINATTVLINIALIKFASIKNFHLRMSIRILLWFEKLPQWNRDVNGTIFEKGFRSQS